MFDAIIGLYEAVAPSIIVVLLLVGGVMTTLKLLKGGAKEAAMTAGMFIIAAIVALTFYQFAPNLVNRVGDTVQQVDGISNVQDLPE